MTDNLDQTTAKPVKPEQDKPTVAPAAQPPVQHAHEARTATAGTPAGKV